MFPVGKMAMAMQISFHSQLYLRFQWLLLLLRKSLIIFFFSAQTACVNCFNELTSGMNLYLTILLRYLIIPGKLILNRIEML